MDVHSNAAVSGKPIEDFLPFHDNQEGGDGVSLEWLSIFVEDCLNGGFTTQPLPTPTTPHQTPNPQAQQGPETQSSSQPKAQKDPSAQGPSKAKANAKRRKVNNHHSDNNFFHTFHVNSSSSDPPLLPQGYWLADSQLLTLPKKDTPQKENVRGPPPQLVKLEEEEEEELEDVKVVVVKGHNDEEAQGPRRCTHCLSHKTPQWRAGPLGPRTLCNACGVRFKSGRLLPEYRPAKSPTFESFKHSNSHKKVMEMRMMSTLLSPHTN